MKDSKNFYSMVLSKTNFMNHERQKDQPETECTCKEPSIVD